VFCLFLTAFNGFIGCPLFWTTSAASDGSHVALSQHLPGFFLWDVRLLHVAGGSGGWLAVASLWVGQPSRRLS